MIVIRHGLPLPRQGMTLLEVLISLAIFLFSLVAISQLVDAGSQRALELNYRSQAALLAQSKLAEAVTGILPLTSTSEQTLEEDPDWNWSLEAIADDVPGLFRVQVTVSRSYAGNGRVQLVLSQYVLDPTKRGGTDASVLGTEDTTSTTGTTTPTNP